LPTRSCQIGNSLCRIVHDNLRGARIEPFVSCGCASPPCRNCCPASSFFLKMLIERGCTLTQLSSHTCLTPDLIPSPPARTLSLADSLPPASLSLWRPTAGDQRAPLPPPRSTASLAPTLAMVDPAATATAADPAAGRPLLLLLSSSLSPLSPPGTTFLGVWRALPFLLQL
jgi:hypothetical protein